MNATNASRIAAKPAVATRDEIVEAIEVLRAEHARTNISTYRRNLLDSLARLRDALYTG